VTISIAIPVFNGERFLEAAIESALDQSRPADEVLAIDDGSVDQSGEIIRSARWGGRVRYVRRENPTGFADAWNRAAEFAQSEFVAILHQDDLLHRDFLLRIEEAAAAFPGCRHFYTGYYYIDENGERTGVSPLPHMTAPERISGKEYAHRYLMGVVANRHLHRCPGVVTERRLVVEKCRYRKEAGLIADDDFFLRVGAFTDVVGISEPLASFRNHEHSETGKLQSVSHRLAMDYLFQVRSYHSGPALLDAEDIGRLEGQAVRFTDAYLLESLIGNRREDIAAARDLRLELESTPGLRPARNRSALASVLWRFGRKQDPGEATTKALSVLLSTLLAAKKGVRRLLGRG